MDLLDINICPSPLKNTLMTTAEEVSTEQQKISNRDTGSRKTNLR